MAELGNPRAHCNRLPVIPHGSQYILRLLYHSMSTHHSAAIATIYIMMSSHTNLESGGMLHIQLWLSSCWSTPGPTDAAAFRGEKQVTCNLMCLRSHFASAQCALAKWPLWLSYTILTACCCQPCRSSCCHHQASLTTVKGRQSLTAGEEQCCGACCSSNCTSKYCSLS